MGRSRLQGAGPSKPLPGLAVEGAKAIEMIILSRLAIALIIVGGEITVLFWIPGIINRAKLREILGQRYPLIFIIYAACGPFLLFLGLFLLLRF
jgi:hypothetical protein